MTLNFTTWLGNPKGKKPVFHDVGELIDRTGTGWVA